MLGRSLYQQQGFSKFLGICLKNFCRNGTVLGQFIQSTIESSFFITKTRADHFGCVAVNLKYHRVVSRIKGGNVCQVYNINRKQNYTVNIKYPIRRNSLLKNV